jgi:cell division protein FtsI/penicillin-binding protein 2
MQSPASQPSFRTSITRRTFLRAATATLLPRISYTLSAYSTPEQTILTDALRNTAAIVTILHQQSGRVLAIHGDPESTDTPGSILKPLLLFAALQQNLIAPTTTVFCRRDLHIDNKSYPCTHPQSNISFDAQEALAYSCNTWFASLALRFTPLRLAETLRAFHLRPALLPALPEQQQLIALGLAGITTSPSQIANAYRTLSNQLGQPFAKPVADGLRDSVSFGMAHNADTSALDISGKTGTASNPPRKPWSHGWFAGFATIRRTPLVISLYIPQGNGADAASLARDFFVMRDKAAS